MTVAVILRLLAGNLEQGHVVGQAEIVDTGESVVFKDQDELLAFILRSGTDDRRSLSDQDGGPATED